MTSPAEPKLDPARLRARLGLAPGEIHFREQLASTQDVAAELARSGSVARLVACHRQSAGRGQHGRTWASGPGDLAFTAIIRPRLEAHRAPLLALATGVAVARVLRSRGCPAALKWPNDVLSRERKLCGILCEAELRADRVAWALLGIGINVNGPLEELPPELATTATTVATEVGHRVSRLELIGDLWDGLAEQVRSLETAGPGRVLEEWSELSCTLGRQVTVSAEGGDLSGRAAGLDEAGHLLLLTASGETVNVSAGRLRHRD
ncbi:MAG: biotin--[acetyl-CoA-carboxylase] ligase [Candidatus Dormibacteria bacterium]